MRMKKLYMTLFAVLLLLAAACGGGAKEETAATTPDKETPAATAAGGGKKVDSSTTGSVKGKVTYSGQASEGARIRMNADPKCDEQHKQPVFTQELEVNGDGSIKDAFVWVKDGLSGYQFDTPSDPKELDQEGCMYQPHVMGVMTNQKIKVVNSDPTTHNIHPVPSQNREWNISQSPEMEPLVKEFPREEVMIPVKCNVHPWMKAYIGVVSHPYFAVTGDDGSFELKGLPPGEYTVQVWHEKLGTQDKKVTVTDKGTAEIDFALGG